MPLPCGFTAFAAKTVPLPCGFTETGLRDAAVVGPGLLPIDGRYGVEYTVWTGAAVGSADGVPAAAVDARRAEITLDLDAATVSPGFHCLMRHPDLKLNIPP